MQAGAGGVGLAAIQLAKAAGATVLATASSDDRLERLHEYGMDHGINYATADVADARCSASPTARASTSSSTRSGARRSRAASPRSPTAAGSAGSGKPAGRASRREVWPLMQKNGSMTGVFLGAEMMMNNERMPHDDRDADRHVSRRGELKVVDRPHLPARRRRRGPPLHREPPGLRPRPAGPLTHGTDGRTVQHRYRDAGGARRPRDQLGRARRAAPSADREARCRAERDRGPDARPGARGRRGAPTRRGPRASGRRSSGCQ